MNSECWLLHSCGCYQVMTRHSVTRPALSLAYISQCCLCILKSQDTAVTNHIFETESDSDSCQHSLVVEFSNKLSKHIYLEITKTVANAVFQSPCKHLNVSQVHKFTC